MDPELLNVHAQVEDVWQVISKQSRLDEWSGEWRKHDVTWTSYNKVLSNDPYCLQWRTGSKVPFWRSRTWEVRVARKGEETEISEKALGPDGESARPMIQADLARLKDIIEPPPLPVFQQPADNLTLLNVYTTQFGSYTSMLWQVPVLGLTAQAFLMTIALGSGIKDDARIAAAALSMIIAWASQTLMHSQRGRAINQAELAKRVSSKLFLKHYLGDDFALEDAVPRKTNAYDVWDADHRIYAIWKVCMIIFAAVDIVVIISASWNLNLF